MSNEEENIKPETQESSPNSQKNNENVLGIFEELQSLMGKETQNMDDVIKMINDGSEKLQLECSEKIKDCKKLNEKYREQMFKESEKLGEEFKKRFLEKSSLVVPEPINEFKNKMEDFQRIANEEFQKIVDEFEKKLSLESKNILSTQSKDSLCLSLKGDSCVGRRTLAIIKPDAYKYADEIINLMKSYGFVIVQEQRVTLSPEQASLFYGDHIAKAFSPRLIDHMSSGPIVALCLASAHCPNTVDAWREVMGPTDVAEAAAVFPNTLRAKYGDPDNQVKNALHGSHSVTDAEKEIHFFFPDIILDPLPIITDISSILDKQAQEILQKGIVMLCKEKPVNPLTWFAHWLLHNNPNSPSTSFEWKPTIHFDDELGTGKKCFMNSKPI